MAQAKKLRGSPKSAYTKFDQLDGSHPFKDSVPGGYIDYPARIRKGAKLAYFNYELAADMGLIPKGHPEKMNKELEAKIVETFSLVIVNEFDEMNGKTFPKEEMKSGRYMATRYLQLQHEDKTGRTSGDGRSVWNGQVRNGRKVWDVSSCGTGATRLSPATSKHGKFFETGDPRISYGCGYAELDEGLATALFSGIFKQNGIATEQTLCVLEFSNKISINVRVHPCLLRPSHFFGHLKQGNLEALKGITDYYIEQKRAIGDYSDCPKGAARYDYMLRKTTETFARVAADFEDEYIFCWLDWDGDNILMDGGIIDYGSIRQFGLFHKEYRYDDTDRFSTNIVEQKEMAKRIVKTFAQMTDYLRSGEKKCLSDFKGSPSAQEFEKIFERRKNENILRKIGFSRKLVQKLLTEHTVEVESFRKAFAYFERANSSRGVIKTNDGITQDAIFCMRDMLRELPQLLLAGKETLSHDEFIDILKSNYAEEKDLRPTPYRKEMVRKFQKAYWALVNAASGGRNNERVLLEISMRSSVINKAERATGDAITLIVDQVIRQRKKLGSDEIYRLFKKLSRSQNLRPEFAVEKEDLKGDRMLRKFVDIVAERREGL